MQPLRPLAHLVFEQAELRPTAPALICGGSQMSYGELRADAESLAAALAQAGLRPGDRVAIEAADPRAFLSALLAVLAAGGIAVPIDTREPAEMQALAEQAGITLWLCDAESQAPASIERVRIDVAGKAGHDEIKLAEDLDAPALMLFTSGTSGRRKGVLLSQQSFAAPADFVNRFMGTDASVIEYVNGGIEHAFALGRFRCLLAAGATAVCDSGAYQPARLLQALATHDCNAISSPASGIAILLEHFPEELAGFASQLRSIKMGSQGLALPFKQQLRQMFPNARLILNYGLSEAQRTTMFDFNSQAGAEHLESSGTALPETGVRICDEAGNELTSGETGVIHVRGPQVALGYWQEPELTEQRFRGGWLETDDVGRLDAEGYLTVLGRRDEVINVGGEKFVPAQVEAWLTPHLEGASFVVCGFTDPSGVLGELLAVCFESDTPDQLEPWRKQRLAMVRQVPPRLLPKHAFCFSSLPRTANGKIQRKAIRREIEAGRAAAV